MRWGIRRDGKGGSSGHATAETHGTSEDAAKAHGYSTRAKTGGTHTLSNQELQHLVNRMNLEQQYGRLTQEKRALQRAESGHKAVKNILGVAKTAQEVYTLVNSPMVAALKKAL